jgi:hypothetical protein
MSVARPIGAKLYIGPIDANAATATAYAALTYSQIGMLESFGDIGPTSNIVKFTPQETGVVKKRVGSVDGGDVDVVCFLDNRDDGQIKCVRARMGISPHAFKLILADASDRGNTTSSIYYFHAYITKASTDVGAADNMPRRRLVFAVIDIPLELESNDIASPPVVTDPPVLLNG